MTKRFPFCRRCLTEGRRRRRIHYASGRLDTYCRQCKREYMREYMRSRRNPEPKPAVVERITFTYVRPRRFPIFTSTDTGSF